MARDTKYYTLLDAAGPRAIASSTNASPIEITAAAPHGYATGDKVTISGHLVNTNANGSWAITVTGANTFTLDGSTGNGVGASSGIFAPRSKMVMCADHEHVVLSFDTDGGGDAAFTVKLVGSIQKTLPDFAKPQGPDNQYEYIQMLDLSDSVEVDGDTGIVAATADVNRLLEANINGLQWLAVIFTDGSEGELTVRARLLGSNSR
jgi:hypothetical protein